MAKDFKASQIRTTQIIASSSHSGKPSIIIASASSPGVDFLGGGIKNATLMNKVGSDVFLFVSGSKGGSTPARTLVSGTLYDGSGAAYSTGGGSVGDSYFTSPAAGKIATSGSAFFVGGSTLPIQGVGNDVFFFVSGSDNPTDSHGHTLFGGTVILSGALIGAGAGEAHNLVLGGGKLIYSWGNDTSNASQGNDISVYISGSSGAKDGASNGVSLFGGDVVISGTLYNGAGVAYSTGGGGGGDSYFTSPGAGYITTTGSAFFAGPAGLLGPPAADVFFFVSGTALGGGGQSKSAVFGGDLVLSGMFSGKASLAAMGIPGEHLILATERLVALSPGTNPEPTFFAADVFSYTSGSIGSKNGPVKGVSVFGGDVQISGTLYDAALNAYPPPSDVNLKDNILYVTSSADIANLTPITFVMKNNVERKRYGISAQDLQKVCPEAVYEVSNYLSIDPVAYTTLLLAHIKNQKKMIDSLDARLAKLEKKK